MFTEEQIIEGCLKNDRNAQRVLYDRYAPLMLGICMRYAQDKAEAEDVLQEGFVKVFLRIKQYKKKGSFEGWLKRIIINTAISNYRKNLKHYYHSELGDVSEGYYKTKFPNSDFTKDELLAVIRELPKGYRIVFNLYAIEGYKHKEIADMLDIDTTTSKSQYSRARKLLQKKLKELSKEKKLA